MIYHIMFQIYFNCKNSQIQNIIKDQQAPIKIFKRQKNIIFVIFLGALHDGKNKKKYSIIVLLLHFAHLTFLNYYFRFFQVIFFVIIYIFSDNFRKNKWIFPSNFFSNGSLQWIKWLKCRVLDFWAIVLYNEWSF